MQIGLKIGTCSRSVQIVNTALADATTRARRADGQSWLACGPGCTSCCNGVFRISALDAARLRSALDDLEARDSARALAIRSRALAQISRLRPHLPGDPTTGALGPDNAAWEAFADLPEAEAPCPVLDPATGRCELYEGRPLTCRIFGPPVMNENGIGICELCYVGAGEAEVMHGEMHLRHEALEDELNAALPPEEFIIAWALMPTDIEGTEPITGRTQVDAPLPSR